jgi:uncharacterized membrane protein
MFTDTISVTGYAIEALGVLVIVGGILIATVQFARQLRPDLEQAYQSYRRQLARSIILGLEFLIAGDIIRTVVVENTLENVAVLGLIIIIRSFLSMALHLEIEGRWPWQKADSEAR